mmetsp:Transcript_17630/g.40450  ORF Transcript_17630/g.40450 Transcript_17630/m.40450 type:complete len:219 (+) Transcript_17630:1260-1916(+)
MDDLDVARRREGWVEVQDSLVVPLGNLPGEDLGEEARRHLEVSGNSTTWDGVKDTNAAQSEGNVQHRTPRRLDRVVSLLGHGDVAGAEVVERRVRRRLAFKLPLPRRRADGTIGHVERETRPLSDEVHRLPEELGRIGRPAAVQLDDGVGGLHRLDLGDARLHGGDRGLQRLQVRNGGGALVLGVAPTVGRDDGVARSVEGLGGRLKGVGGRISREDD